MTVEIPKKGPNEFCCACTDSDAQIIVAGKQQVKTYCRLSVETIQNCVLTTSDRFGAVRRNVIRMVKIRILVLSSIISLKLKWMSSTETYLLCSA